MKASRRVLDRRDAYIGRQARIEAPVNGSHIVPGCDLRAGDLTEGVYAGIRPAGAMHRHRRTIEPRERLLEQSLDRFAVGLPLPPDEARAVVGDSKLQNARGPTGLW